MPILRTVSCLPLLFVSPLVAQVRPAGTLITARRCTLARNPRGDPAAAATVCAEEFIKANGYTVTLPASDSSLWATEGIEFASSWAEVFAHRHNTLLPNAEHAGCDSMTCGVTFRLANAPDGCVLRVVTMTRHFTGMRVQHQ